MKKRILLLLLSIPVVAVAQEALDRSLPYFYRLDYSPIITPIPVVENYYTESDKNAMAANVFAKHFSEYQDYTIVNYSDYPLALFFTFSRLPSINTFSLVCQKYSMKPLFIIKSDGGIWHKYIEKRITKIIAYFNKIYDQKKKRRYYNYINKDNLGIEMKRGRDNNFFLNTLGQPDSIYTNPEGNTVYDYTSIVLTFDKDDKLKAYDFKKQLYKRKKRKSKSKTATF